MLECVFKYDTDIIDRRRFHVCTVSIVCLNKHSNIFKNSYKIEKKKKKKVQTDI